MAKLTMQSTIKSAKYGNKTINELVSVKGAIFSMIKDGYEFDDDVLASAHILKTISNERFTCRVGGGTHEKNEKLQKETMSIRQIISEINTIENDSKSSYKEDDDNWENDINNYNTEDDYE